MNTRDVLLWVVGGIGSLGLLLAGTLLSLILSELRHHRSALEQLVKDFAQFRGATDVRLNTLEREDSNGNGYAPIRKF